MSIMISYNMQKISIDSKILQVHLMPISPDI